MLRPVIALPPSSPDPGSVPGSPFTVPEHAAWLVLATDGPALELPGLVPGTAVLVTNDTRHFRDVLLAEWPRIVVVCQPPAGPAELDLVTSERRRRSGLRALHLAPPDAVADRLAALAQGFDDALTMATTGSELAGRLGWLEARRPAPEQDRDRPAPGARLPVADRLELDLVAHELRNGERGIHLRPKEFGLLALLAAHPGRAFARRELLQRVWGAGTATGARTVDVHVRWLRSKIEPDPERPIHLVTVRGVGYRLDAPRR